MTEKICPNCEDNECEKNMDFCEGCERCKTCFGTGTVEYQLAVDDFDTRGCPDCFDFGDDRYED